MIVSPLIVLPFPPSSLSGHAKGSWHGKSGIVKQWRDRACDATREAMPTIPAEGDIRVHITFIPPNLRGDRVNFPNRCKPIYDGIADALGVNDARFLPSFTFKPPAAPGLLQILVW